MLALELEIERTGKRLTYVNTASPNDGSIASHIIALVESESAGKYLVDHSRNVLRGMLQTIDAGNLDGRVPPYGYDTLYIDAAGKPLFIARYNQDRSKQLFEPRKQGKAYVPGRCLRALQSAERPPRSRSDKATLILGDPTKREIIRRMFAWASRERFGYKRIAQRLNRQGILAPTGGRWSTGSIRDILINPVYRGAYRWNYRSKAKFFRSTKNGLARVKDRNGLKQVRSPEEDVIIKEEIFPAIVTKDLWYAAQKTRKMRQHRIYRGRAVHAVYLASSLAYCPCGHRLQGYTTKSKGFVYHRYRCSERHLGGPSSCEMPNVTRETIDTHLVAWLRDHCIAPLLNNPDVWTVFEEKLKSAFRHQSNPRQAEERIRQIEQLLKKTVEMIDENNLPLLNEKLSKLREEKAELQATLDVNTRKVVTLEDCRLRAREYLNVAQHLLTQGTPQEIKDLVRCFVHRIEIDPKHNRGRIFYFSSPDVLKNKLSIQMERVKGVEPSTSTLARSRSTTELHPRRSCGISTYACP